MKCTNMECNGKESANLMESNGHVHEMYTFDFESVVTLSAGDPETSLRPRLKNPITTNARRQEESPEQ